MGGSLFLLRVFRPCVFLPVLLFIVPFRCPLFSELKSIRGDADQVAGVRKRRASTFLPINPLKLAKTNNTRFGRIENALG